MSNLMALSSIIIIVAAMPCNARTQQPAGPSLRLSVISGRPVVDNVFVDGQGPYRFLVDTGAQTNQMDLAIARKIGLVATFQVELATAAGATHAGGARVRQVTLGTADATDQEFLFTTLEGPRTLSSGIQGVLGQEFLSHFDYLLDFHSRRLVFGPAASEGAQLPTRMLNGRPAIETSRGQLVLDSGTDTTILGSTASGGSKSPMLTASGSGTTLGSENVRLKIGEREIRAAAVFVPAGAVDGGGLLPACLFHSVFVSNSGRYVVLEQ